MTEPSPIIHVSKVSIHQGKLLVLRDLSFSVHPGEFVYVVGKTGSGKSSLLKMLYGDVPLADGKATVVNFDLNALKNKDVPQLRRKIGIVFQDFQLLADRSVDENLRFVLQATGWKGKSKMDYRIAEVLDWVGLKSKGFKFPWELSGGEQQRLSLALALAADPDVIFLDEPTSGVDIDGRDIIADIIRNLAARGTKVVLASHDMAEAEKVATHAVLFNSGKVIASGEILTLLTSRKHLRFTSSVGLVPAELAVSINSPVVAIGDGVYEVASEPTPQLMTRISQWLADNSHPLLGVDMGTESLEDTYRRLTRGAK